MFLEYSITPDGKIFVTEREGEVRLIKDSKLLDEPMVKLNVANVGEAGLLEGALHLNFTESGYLYLYYTYYNC
jgi:glucose/arabinose dehydrogenase